MACVLQANGNDNVEVKQQGAGDPGWQEDLIPTPGNIRPSVKLEKDEKKLHGGANHKNTFTDIRR